MLSIKCVQNKRRKTLKNSKSKNSTITESNLVSNILLVTIPKILGLLTYYLNLFSLIKKILTYKHISFSILTDLTLRKPRIRLY